MDDKIIDPRQNKEAIDAIFKASDSSYLMILSAIDVVPHQDMANPAYAPPDDDPDKFAYGDLPYACDTPYSRDIATFKGPTRVGQQRRSRSHHPILSAGGAEGRIDRAGGFDGAPAIRCADRRARSDGSRDTRAIQSARRSVGCSGGRSHCDQCPERRRCRTK